MNFQDKDGNTIDLNFAQEIMRKSKTPKHNSNARYQDKAFFNGLTTSKLRTLFSVVNNLYTKNYTSKDKLLSGSMIDELEYVKVKFAYESGREVSVKNFLNETKLIEVIDQVIEQGTKKSFLDFCHYFEGLVAYAKYYGMGDK